MERARSGYCPTHAVCSLWAKEMGLPGEQILPSRPHSGL